MNGDGWRERESEIRQKTKTKKLYGWQLTFELHKIYLRKKIYRKKNFCFEFISMLTCPKPMIRVCCNWPHVLLFRSCKPNGTIKFYHLLGGHTNALNTKWVWSMVSQFTTECHLSLLFDFPILVFAINFFSFSFRQSLPFIHCSIIYEDRAHTHPNVYYIWIGVIVSSIVEPMPFTSK